MGLIWSQKWVIVIIDLCWPDRWPHSSDSNYKLPFATGSHNNSLWPEVTVFWKSQIGELWIETPKFVSSRKSHHLIISQSILDNLLSLNGWGLLIVPHGTCSDPTTQQIVYFTVYTEICCDSLRECCLPNDILQFVNLQFVHENSFMDNKNASFVFEH